MSNPWECKQNWLFLQTQFLQSQQFCLLANFFWRLWVPKEWYKNIETIRNESLSKLHHQLSLFSVPSEKWHPRLYFFVSSPSLRDLLFSIRLQRSITQVPDTLMLTTDITAITVTTDTPGADTIMERMVNGRQVLQLQTQIKFSFFYENRFFRMKKSFPKTVKKLRNYLFHFGINLSLSHTIWTGAGPGSKTRRPGPSPARRGPGLFSPPWLYSTFDKQCTLIHTSDINCLFNNYLF